MSDEATEHDEGPKRVSLERMRQLAEDARMQLEYTTELQIVTAKLMRSKYEAFCEAGFTSQEAFELVRFRGLN